MMLQVLIGVLHIIFSDRTLWFISQVDDAAPGIRSGVLAAPSHRADRRRQIEQKRRVAQLAAEPCVADTPRFEVASQRVQE